MFTGIVEEVGTIRNIKRGQHSAVLTIHAKTVLEETRIGDSIAVNGICLTVTRLFPDGFSADVMHETLNRSSLAGLTAGSVVNLERAMPANGRFGGHIVAGHVDGVGHISDIRRDDTAVWYTVHAGPEILRYVVEKGSITIDGISLTVAAVDGEGFSVSTIPHTVTQTNLSQRRRGDPVNLETDVVGKYIEKLLRPEETKPHSLHWQCARTGRHCSGGEYKARQSFRCHLPHHSTSARQRMPCRFPCREAPAAERQRPLRQLHSKYVPWQVHHFHCTF